MKIIWLILVLNINLIAADLQENLINCLYHITNQINPSSLIFVTSNNLQLQFGEMKTNFSLQGESVYRSNDKEIIDSILQRFHHSSKWPIALLSTGISKQKIVQNLHDFYILITDKGELSGAVKDIEQQTYLTTIGKDSNLRIKYIAIVLHRFEDANVVAKDVLSVLWKYKIINAIVLVPTKHNFFVNNTISLFGVYTWFPFGSERRCANVSDAVLLDRWVSYNSKQYFLNALTLFPYKTTRNLNSCPLTVSAFEFEPSVINKKEIGDELIYEDGTDVRLLKEIASRMNMKIRYRKPTPDYWGVALKNGSWTGLTGEVMTGYSDMAIDCFYNRAHLNKGLEYSTVYIIDYLGWYVPCAKRIGRWKSLIKVFDLSLWLGFLATYVVVSIFMWIIAKLNSLLGSYQEYIAYKNIIKCFLNFWAIIVEESASNNPTRVPSIRIVFLTWVIYCWCVNTIYQSNLVTFMVSPGYEHQFSTEKEILDSDMLLCMVDTLITCCIPNPDVYPSGRVHTSSSYNVCVDTIAKGHNLAFLFNRYHLEYVTLRKYIGSSGRPLICPIAEELSSQRVVMPFTKGSLYLERFNYFITHILEAGIFNHWHDDMKYTATLKTMIGLQIQDEEYIKLSLQHLQSPFLFLILGYLVSLLTFAIEFISGLKKTKEAEVQILK
ncbi:hypothetical protein L9F63_002825 [Diploptera punctata]|uniref:Ionotropic glutamate receptor C-terminal domain-containing protein n=1 Tax=Diploptera punctata TaxID=6984 RepID=A0AAD7ZR68_DIPPU|nr:hypothetical protein L9F63_002825 [Diploptera punctata]